MALGEEGLSFLEAEATEDEKGNSHVTQKKFLEFMASRGVPKGVIDSYNSASEELINGMYRFVNKKLTEKVKQAKKNGTDPSKESAKITTNIPNGSICVEQKAAKTYPIPKEPGKSVTRPCVTSLDINQKRLFDKDMLAESEESMKKLLGI